MAEPTLFFEDFTPGQVIDLGTYEMTEPEIIDFGRRFDPQYFHIDPQAALDSPFGGLIASGWHTCSAWARLWIDSVLSRADSRGSGGMQEVRWLEPVRPGDALSATVEILDTRPSARHADRGTVFIGCTMTNQHGLVVFTAHGRGLIGRRHPLSEATATATGQGTGAADAQAREATEVRSEDGVKLNLRMMGGSGPDLLVCHATGFHGLAYRPLAQCLKNSFRVWALDFRGHGSSGPAPGEDYAWSAMGGDVAACAAAIGTPQLYGFGHSMGGAALLLAELSRPGTFAGLFLYEPIVLPRGFFDQPGANPLAAGARNRREVFNSRAEALARYSSRSPLGVMRADALAAYVEGAFVDLPGRSGPSGLLGGDRGPHLRGQRRAGDGGGGHNQRSHSGGGRHRRRSAQPRGLRTRDRRGAARRALPQLRESWALRPAGGARRRGGCRDTRTARRPGVSG